MSLNESDQVIPAGPWRSAAGLTKARFTGEIRNRTVSFNVAGGLQFANDELKALHGQHQRKRGHAAPVGRVATDVLRRSGGVAGARYLADAVGCWVVRRSGTLLLLTQAWMFHAGCTGGWEPEPLDLTVAIESRYQILVPPVADAQDWTIQLTVDEMYGDEFSASFEIPLVPVEGGFGLDGDVVLDEALPGNGETVGLRLQLASSSIEVVDAPTVDYAPMHLHLTCTTEYVPTWWGLWLALSYPFPAADWC